MMNSNEKIKIQSITDKDDDKAPYSKLFFYVCHKNSKRKDQDLPYLFFEKESDLKSKITQLEREGFIRLENTESEGCFKYEVLKYSFYNALQLYKKGKVSKKKFYNCFDGKKSRFGTTAHIISISVWIILSIPLFLLLKDINSQEFAWFVIISFLAVASWISG